MKKQPLLFLFVFAVPIAHVHERQGEHEIIDTFAQQLVVIRFLLLLQLFVQRFGQHVAGAAQLVRSHGRKQKRQIGLFAFDCHGRHCHATLVAQVFDHSFWRLLNHVLVRQNPNLFNENPFEQDRKTKTKPHHTKTQPKHNQNQPTLYKSHATHPLVNFPVVSSKQLYRNSSGSF